MNITGAYAGQANIRRCTALRPAAVLCINSVLRRKMCGNQRQHAEKHIRREREDGTGHRAEAWSNFERDPRVPECRQIKLEGKDEETDGECVRKLCRQDKIVYRIRKRALTRWRVSCSPQTRVSRRWRAIAIWVVACWRRSPSLVLGLSFPQKEVGAGGRPALVDLLKKSMLADERG